LSKELGAARSTVDTIPDTVWDTDLYTLWLKALRCLSNAASSPISQKFPQVMRTKAWAHHDMNTQFASWAQLRHDTILYVKQSYSGSMTLCDYPFGFVDPRIAFWNVCIQMGEKMKTVLGRIGFNVNWPIKWIDTVTQLRNLAQKQLNMEPFTSIESLWLKRTIAKWHKGGSGGGWRRDGWYCKLFYAGEERSEQWDALVADVHTAPPSPDFGFGGSVVSNGVGNVNMMICAMNSGNDAVVYAGPVFSHYEFCSKGIVRYTDSEWKAKLERKANEAQLFNNPQWTSDHLVPSQNMKNVRNDED